MELKEGMYVRTKSGIIARCNEIIEDLDIGFDREVFEFGTGMVVEIPWNYKEEYILKASNNIIDLIEVGDYVNGVMIENMNNSIKPIPIPQYKNECGEYIDFDESDIKTIVTKEQFESISYKVEE